MKKLYLLLSIIGFYQTAISQCSPNSEVYLTNIAFVDAQTLTNLGNTYFDYVYNGANIFDDQGNAINVLPASINENPNNPANLINVGVPIRFKFQTQNRKINGQSIVSGSCKLRTNNTQITITDSTAGLNNVAWNNNAWSTNEFEFMVHDTVTQNFTAYFEVVVVEDGIEYSTPCIPIPIKAISMHSRTVDDDDNPDSMGDGDGLVEPNEKIETFIKINNNSEFDANFVQGGLFYFDGTYYYNNIGDIHIWWGDVGTSGPVYPISWYNYFQDTPNPIAAGATAVTSQFDFVFDYNYPQTYSFSLPFQVATGYYIFGAAQPPVFMLSSFNIEYNAGQPPIPTSASVASLDCANVQTSGSLTQGTVASAVSATLPYSGGNGGNYNAINIASTGVTGLTANISQGVLTNGNGNIAITISGTPSTSGTANFSIDFAGQICNFSMNVQPSIGVSEIATLNNQIRVYPNPTADQLFIETSKFKESSLDLVIYDMSGRVVKNEKIKYLNSPLSINLSDLKAGIYNVQIIAGNTTYKERIIKL
jgi:hypothetical protein